MNSRDRLLLRLDTFIGTMVEMRKLFASASMSDAMCEAMERHVCTLATSAGQVAFAMRDSAIGAVAGQPAGRA